MVVVCLTRDVVLLLPPQTTCQDIKTQTQTSGEQTVIKYTMWSHTLAHTHPHAHATQPCTKWKKNLLCQCRLLILCLPFSSLVLQRAVTQLPGAWALLFPVPLRLAGSPLFPIWTAILTQTHVHRMALWTYTLDSRQFMEKNNVISSWIWSRHWVLHNVALIIQLKMIVRSKEGRMFQALLKWVTLLCYNFEYMFLEKELQTNNPIRIMMYMW